MSVTLHSPAPDPLDIAKLQLDFLSLQAELRLAHLRIKQLEAKIFGRSSEKLPPEDPAQLKLLAELEKAAEPAAPPAVEDVLVDKDDKPAAKRRARHPLPENIETVVTVIDLPEAEKVCPSCGKPKRQIGQETSEELEVIPARFIRKQVVRPKYACPCGEAKVAVAPLPPRLIEKGRCGPGLLAFILLAKYLDHLPLYRIEQIFKERHQIHLARQTMADWVEKAAEWLQAIYREMKTELFKGDYIQIDETPVRVQDPDVLKKTATGYIWVYAQPGGDVLFDFHKSRALAPPLEFLSGFTGTLQTDGYNVYEALVQKRPELERIGCLAHARRKFHEALEDNQNLALWFLQQIGLLYRIERKAREEDLSHEQRHNLRQAHAPEIMKTIAEQLDIQQKSCIPQSPMGKAISYARNQWESLQGYLKNGKFEIDNNLVENAIRPTAVGKKNWLFLGHPEAGWRSAVIYSILISCRRRGINPADYLADIFNRLPTMKANEIPELIPANWKPKPIAH